MGAPLCSTCEKRHYGICTVGVDETCGGVEGHAREHLGVEGRSHLLRPRSGTGDEVVRVAPSGESPTVGIKPGPHVLSQPAKTGRPRIEDKDKTLEAMKPWIAAGMSRRTWYRRRAEARS